MREMVRASFRRHAGETDPETIEDLRQDAIRGLSNYLLYEQGGQKGLEKQAAESRGEIIPEK